MLMDEQGMPAAVWDSKAAYTYLTPMTMVLAGIPQGAQTAGSAAPRVLAFFWELMMTHHHR